MKKNLKLKLKSKKISSSGFTLIEILVVISIIGILIAVSILGLQGSFETARDAKRKSDVKEYQSSLENYSIKNANLFPIDTTAVQSDTTLCTSLGLTGCPADPKGTNKYYYCSNATGTTYTLYATLENASSTTFWTACSNGKTGAYVNASAPSCAVCSLP